MRLAMLLFIFLTYIMGDTFNNVSNRPSCQKYNRINRYDYLTKLIRTSNIDKKDNWYKIYFYHEKRGIDTIIWVRFFGMNLL